ncbi:MAG: hypothetical protein ABI725_01205 [Chloroflexota bacterium]
MTSPGLSAGSAAQALFDRSGTEDATLERHPERSVVRVPALRPNGGAFVFNFSDGRDGVAVAIGYQRPDMEATLGHADIKSIEDVDSLIVVANERLTVQIRSGAFG